MSLKHFELPAVLKAHDVRWEDVLSNRNNRLELDRFECLVSVGESRRDSSIQVTNLTRHDVMVGQVGADYLTGKLANGGNQIFSSDGNGS